MQISESGYSSSPKDPKWISNAEGCLSFRFEGAHTILSKLHQVGDIELRKRDLKYSNK